MQSNSNDDTNHLDDAELLSREMVEHDEFKRIEQHEPRFRDATYGLVHGSRALVESWERWWHTNAAARLRGLLPRGMGK
jgi:hypothetical protein